MTEHGHHHHGPDGDHDRAPDHDHDHGHATFDEAEWARWANDLESEGEILGDFVTSTVERLSTLAGWVAPRTVADVGSGPGVATCELARLLPAAHVTAFDSSPAMLERAAARTARLGFDDRVQVVLGEIPNDLARLGEVDLVWASMSLHHVGDEVAALRALGGVLAPAGLIAIAEMADPMHMLPADLGLGRAGLSQRLEQCSAEWFAEMRHGLDSTVESDDLAVMVTRAGLTVVDDRIARIRHEAPLAQETRSFVTRLLTRSRSQLGSKLESDDLEVIDVLLDDDHPLSIAKREDVFLQASRRIVIAHATPAT